MIEVKSDDVVRCIWNEDDTRIGHPDGLCMVTVADNVCQQNV